MIGLYITYVDQGFKLLNIVQFYFIDIINHTQKYDV